MALDAYALITVAQAQSGLGKVLSGKTTAQIEDLINQVSAAIEAYIKRKVLDREYTEKYDGPGDDTILLRQWPVINVSEVNADSGRTFGPSTVIAASNYLLYPGDMTTGGAAGALVALDSAWSEGLQNHQITYSAGWTDTPYDIMAACLAEIGAQVAVQAHGGYESERIDGYAYTRPAGGGVAATMGLASAEAIGLLGPYRRVVF